MVAAIPSVDAFPCRTLTSFPSGPSNAPAFNNSSYQGGAVLSTTNRPLPVPPAVPSFLHSHRRCFRAARHKLLNLSLTCCRLLICLVNCVFTASVTSCQTLSFFSFVLLNLFLMTSCVAKSIRNFVSRSSHKALSRLLGCEGPSVGSSRSSSAFLFLFLDPLGLPGRFLEGSCPAAGSAPPESSASADCCGRSTGSAPPLAAWAASASW
mmetsp:Transcript_786/g.2376  ORF Transcript_786/g.2376 Transcript_786/m.2376 type:complete len:209 (+) Transcript_786:337-963(+)